MHITSLTLRRFRTYENLVLPVLAGTTAFVGPNAEGKTNILEAVYCCCVGRSHRAHHDREMIAEGHDEGRIILDYENNFGLGNIEIQLFSNKRKRILCDGKPVPRIGELYGKLNCVLFSPEDLALVKGGPGLRRAYVDIALSQARPAYFLQLQRYTHILKQRNALLRAEQPGTALWAWDEQLAATGAEVMAGRSAFIDRLAAKATEIHRDICGETLNVSYEPNVDAGNFLNILQKDHAADISRGSTNHGPHRDDIMLHVENRPARIYASQGQQRTVALALRIAELCVLRDASGQWPVLLLDDVLSELDGARRAALLALLPHVQTLITGTDAKDLRTLADCAIYNVLNGSVERSASGSS
ncbi:MAG: DNA replication/repair protein RecF [Clostridia bacterium]|nr:DNA replication/repair protein RecF [Clostridia bacterium]